MLFNPWIYDFAAYDFWQKPYGLLSLAAILKQQGLQISLIDCLDRFDADLASVHQQQDGTGKYHKEFVPKPKVLQQVPRHYGRYGIPYKLVVQKLQQLEAPDIILVTSMMTYWYPALQDAVKLLRRFFPDAIIVLGGVYATLCPQHAQQIIQPDLVVRGPGENKLLKILADIDPRGVKHNSIRSCSHLPFPLYSLYPRLNHAGIMTSRGCPFHCDFCASRLLSPYERRSPRSVIEEIRQLHSEHGVRHFCFYDDALLLEADRYIKPIFEYFARHSLDLEFHMPNGVHPRYIDSELAQLFNMAGVKTIRLSYESKNEKLQNQMAKVNDRDLEQAIANLGDAGYPVHSIGVYLLMGLPEQTIEDVLKSAAYIVSLGAKPYTASFSPIPGTREWKKSIYLGLWRQANDLLLSNNTLFPIWTNKYGYSACMELLLQIKTMSREFVTT